MVEKSVIVIGNGFSLKDKSFGNKINEFDEVIRINDWKTKLFERDAGTKTTIWGTYNPEKGMANFISGYKKLGVDMNDIKRIASDIQEIWYISWKPENLMEDWKKNDSLKELGIYSKCKRHMSPIYSKRIKQVIENPTTGFTLIYILTHMYDKIYLAGFDFAGEKTGETSLFHHYYGEKILKDVKSRDIHNPKKEYELVEKMISDGKVEYLTNGTSIKKSECTCKIQAKTCNNCGITSTLYEWEQLLCNYCEEPLWC